MKPVLAHGAWADPKVVFADPTEVGFHSCVNSGASEEDRTHIGKGVTIGAFCIIEKGARIGDGVTIDHYCRVGAWVTVGPNTRLLYGAQVFDEVTIGRNCIIAGGLVDRTVVEDSVTFQGNTAHTHADPNRDWDTTVEPSPTIRSGCVVGIGALLMGGITVGPRAYVAAGEIVKCDVAADTIINAGKPCPRADWRGIIKVRDT